MNERSDVSAWRYVGATPLDNVASQMGGANPGVAGAIYVWERTFTLRYKCACGGKTAEVLVPGNRECFTATRGIAVGGGYPTIALDPELELPGAFGVIVGFLGPVIEFVGFVNPAAVDAEKPADPDDSTDANGPRAILQPVPVALCGRAILFGDDRVIAWPAAGAGDVSAPDTRTELPCPGGAKLVSGVAYGTLGLDDDKAIAETDAKRSAMLAAEAMVRRKIAGYRCAGTCEYVTIPRFGSPRGSSRRRAGLGDMLVPAFEAQYLVEWSVVLLCMPRSRARPR
jgi:hypothetical protein